MSLDASAFTLPAGSVLELSSTSAEWLAADPAAEVGSAPVLERGARTLAAAAVAARGAHTGAAVECTLALGAGLVSVRLLELPQLKRAELALVLERKAAGWLEAPASDVLYQATEMGALEGQAQDAPEHNGERTWLVTAARRSELVALRQELKRAGFALRRIVPAQLAALDLARAALPEPTSAAIVVQFAPTRITIALVRDATLVHLDELAGDFLATPTLAASLIQSVRTNANYWRKLSRGSTLDQVVVIGLPSERGALLGHALEASLPGARVRVVPGAPPPDRAELASAGRRAALAAALVHGPFAPPLSVRVPLARSVTAAAVGASVLLVAGAGLVARHTRLHTLDELTGQTERMRQRATALGLLAEQHGLERERIHGLDLRFARMLEVGSAGLAHEALLEDVLRALEGRSALASLDLRAQGEGRALVHIEATAGPAPAAFARAVSAVRDDLVARPDWSDVELALPSELGASEAEEPLRFTIDAGVATQR
jgi:hypothetical protein